MKSKHTLTALLFVALFTIFSTSASFAQDAMKKDEAMSKDDGMKKDAMMKDDRPIVAVIQADWCPYCKAVEPVVADLQKDYSEKFNFVFFDVTDAKTVAESEAKAEKLGLAEFFSEYKKKTSAVVLMKDSKVVYKTYNNSKKSEYVKAFDKALK